jgi:lysozyme family protein
MSKKKRTKPVLQVPVRFYKKDQALAELVQLLVKAGKATSANKLLQEALRVYLEQLGIIQDGVINKEAVDALRDASDSLKMKKIF